ncbi:urea amidolyase family protein [Acidipropionibacterium acidipropionici]|jgi:KipI family sensor histidine kinase inhibitor|uniref:Urea amidolyase n=1 Tax=Acidipropionibacterium acidipropionici TaxID=1748 RepID=A0AAC8YH60_9ACTN|nr:urea amidolyase family protein [Acidipropionibacterium acidipropionici]AMS06558.1 urea amidolyase [Acidipropionibacterium acidipropionici]AOZ48000.1 urea amidolyase [Acidipropionibacterium acidipropionici]
MSVDIRPVGDRALLIDLGDLDRVLALHDELSAHPGPGQLEVLAAATTVLVRADTPASARALAEHVRGLDLEHAADRDDTLVDIEVCYDGEDLDAVAELTSMSRDGVIAAHTGQLWTAAFGGFAPGFAYCVGENHLLDVARRPSPRTAVPAGAVGLAGQFSAAYPRTTPGGWQLIGRTAAPLWDAARPSPALVVPGNRVRYVAVREAATVVDPEPVTAAAAPEAGGLVVVATGMQSLLTDLGRPGHADLGVAESGAMDRGSARLANAVVGNPADAPMIENLVGGLAVRALGHRSVAVTGARVPLRVDPPEDSDRRAWTPGRNAPILLDDGDTLSLGAPTAGLRSYLGVKGGITAPRVLGSASSDVMSGLGPEPLRAGDLLAVGAPAWNATGSPGVEVTALPEGHARIRLRPGPRDDWFDAGALDSLTSQEWVISNESNRIGLRLEGEPLRRRHEGELASEATVAGAVQVPTGGLPVVFMRDHPVTGGYPVIGVVEPADLDVLAQLPPGSTIRFSLM